jgi:hypothetical protein
MQRGDRGPHVTALQRELAALGYPVGLADGICGPRTLAACEAHQRAKQAGIVVLLGAHEGIHREGPRPWANVTGITIHQTAATLGENPARWVKWPIKGPNGAIEHSCLRAHVGVTRGGQVLLCNPLDQLVWHGNRLSLTDIGIELDGTYEGVEGERSTWWQAPGHKSPQVPTPALLEAARRAIRWACAEVAANGGKIRFLHAHRQASKDRRSDPGSRIWAEVALALEAEGLLSTRPGYVVGTGRAIPKEWDPRSDAPY